MHKSENVIFSQNGGIKKIDNIFLVLGVTKNLLLVGTFSSKGCLVVFGFKKCWVLTIVKPKKVVYIFFTHTHKDSNNCWRI